MATLTFTFSDKLKEKIEKIEEIRKEILTFPISPRDEMTLKWEATIDRIYWSMALIDNSISKKEISDILLHPEKERLEKKELRVVELKNVFDFMYYDILATKLPINIQILRRTYEIGCKDNREANELGKNEERDLQKILEYIQAGSDHPIIKAGIIQIQILDNVPFRYANNRMSRLSSYLFLYKHFFDLKQLLVLEEYYREDLIGYKKAVEDATKSHNLTFWLEYFADGVLSNYQKIINRLKTDDLKRTTNSTLFKINSRQKKIISLLEKPGVIITNKNVQKIFKVSQITASRDLSGLANLGLILTHGKGRGVYYTRA
jgi:Fic family protein